MTKKDSKVGDAYAYALLKVLYKDINIKSFSELVFDIIDFSIIFKTFPSINEFLSNPTYDKKKKKQFLSEFFDSSLSPVLMNFLNLLCDSKRIIYISSILKLFLEILLKTTNSYTVEIEIPFIEEYKLDLKKLNNVLSDWFIKNKKTNQVQTIKFNCFKNPFILFVVKEKPELLGGFKINFLSESKVIDYSIAGKIVKIAKVLDY
jgi:ATP synthase F1 delta subunit